MVNLAEENISGKGTDCLLQQAHCKALLPESAAQLRLAEGFERNWSAWGRTCTNLRNRLSHETAEKLVFVKGNLDADKEEVHEMREL